MAELLAFGADFLERLSNPAYGRRMNDEYALRMASLLESERIFGFLRDEIPRLRDPSTSRRMDGYGLSPGRAQTT